MTYTTSTWVHPQDEERARLREELAEYKACEVTLKAQLVTALERKLDAQQACAILSRKLDEETRKHAATLEELRAVRAQLEQSQRFGGLLRRASDRREPCGCPVDLHGAVVPSHECPRHGRLAQWVAADGGLT